MRCLKIIVATVVGAALQCAASPMLQAAPDKGPGFPRLSMWHPRSEINTLAESARYDAAVGNFQEPYRGFSSFGKALKSKNRSIQLLTYFTSSVIRVASLDQGSTKSESYIKDWPARWFLTEAGSTTATAIDAKTDTIPVSAWDMTGPVKGRKPKKWDIFRVDYDVLCDGEIMNVVEVDPDSKTLTVKRGMSGTRPKAHDSGVRIAPIVRFWRGSYMMNLSSNCAPAKLHGASKDELWSDYSFRMSKRGAADYFWFTGGEQDGFLLDLMADTISWVMWADTRSIDLDQDNKADSFETMDKAWLEGIKHVTELFHEQFPGKELLRNQSRCWRTADYNGENFESFPRNAWDTEDIDEPRGRTKYWHRYFFGHPDEERAGVMDFVKEAQNPNYTMLETCDIETDLSQYALPEVVGEKRTIVYKPDFPKMRWGLTSALLAGCYYAWVVHSDGHGMLGMLWFDEYDDAGEGRGYLGYPKGEITKIVTDKRNKQWGCWGREYDKGYVICNPLDYAVDAPLPPGKWQRLKGKEDPVVNNGAVEEGKVKVGPYDGLILKRAG